MFKVIFKSYGFTYPALNGEYNCFCGAYNRAAAAAKKYRGDYTVQIVLVGGADSD